MSSSMIVSRNDAEAGSGVEVSLGGGENAETPGSLFINTVPGGKCAFDVGGLLYGIGGWCKYWLEEAC